MRRYTIISTDCHAGPLHAEGGFLDYIDPGYREALKEDMANEPNWQEMMEELFAPELREEQDQSLAVLDGGRRGVADPDRHLKELELDGVVADIIFPDDTQQNGPPFHAAFGPGHKGANHELQGVGAWAYNRWLADFVSHAPGRLGGLAVMTIHDIDEAVRQVIWAKEHGLKGVILPAGVGNLPFYHDPCYEPIWSVCEDLGMPLHTHVGSATPDYGDLPGSTTLFATESMWFSHRPFWFLLWGAVFERHPRLQMVFAEQGADWVPDLLQLLDFMYETYFAHEQKRLSLKPSEYWRRQCTVQAMFLSQRDVDARHIIGIENMTWGSDYPHYEGSYPKSIGHLQMLLKDVPEDEVQALLATNAARLYGFDMAELDAVAAALPLEACQV
jgi:predicted TIM-barrel fold metal-dependent hydrolase